MRKVVERLTCDVGGEVAYSDQTNNGEPVIEEVTFAWQDQPFVLDVCGGCRSKMMDYSVGELVQLARIVQTHKKQTKTGGKKRARGKGKYHQFFDGEKYVCPDCPETSNTGAGLGRHIHSAHPDNPSTKVA